MPELTTALIDASLPSAARPGVPLASVSDMALRQGMEAMIAGRPSANGVWVFAYGALLWRGGFGYDAEPVGFVHGLVRRYSIWDDRNRGTPDRCALTLGLDRQPGVCAGVAFHLPEAGLSDSFWTIWKEEMSGGVYRAEWVDTAISVGTVRAITFIADQQHPLYAGSLPEAHVADILAAGTGPGGTAATYLMNTAAALRARGVADPYLDRTEAAVARRLRRSMTVLAGDPR